jgi:hypothetical protein
MSTKDPEKLKLQRQRGNKKFREKHGNSYFSNWVKNNRERYNELQRKSYQKNKEKILKKSKEYRQNNKEIVNNKKRELYQKNKEIINKKVKSNYRDFYKKPLFMFNNILYRLRYKKNYNNKKILFTKDKFIEWVLNNKDYIRIFNEWKENDFKRGLSPSIDRIDNNGDYSFDNIQVITQIDNGIKSEDVL